MARKNIGIQFSPEKFWARVNKTAGCWEWTASLNGWGYGQVSFRGARVGTHRISWILTNGDISDGLLVCHKCDNPKCVNPDHLFLGTQQDNMTDMISKDRHAAGSKDGRAKLNETTVVDIRKEYSLGETTHKLLAIKYGVSQSAIRFIIIRRTWKHVTEAPATHQPPLFQEAA